MQTYCAGWARRTRRVRNMRVTFKAQMRGARRAVDAGHGTQYEFFERAARLFSMTASGRVCVRHPPRYVDGAATFPGADRRLIRGGTSTARDHERRDRHAHERRARHGAGGRAGLRSVRDARERNAASDLPTHGFTVSASDVDDAGDLVGFVSATGRTTGGWRATWSTPDLRVPPRGRDPDRRARDATGSSPPANGRMVASRSRRSPTM